MLPAAFKLGGGSGIIYFVHQITPHIFDNSISPLPIEASHPPPVAISYPLSEMTLHA